MDFWNRKKLQEELIRDEDLRTLAYKDSVGLWTIGVGHLIGEDPGHPGLPRMFTLTRREAIAFLDSDIDEARRVVEVLVPETRYWASDSGQGGHREIEPVRYRALVNMAFNLGQTRLAGFKKFLTAVNKKDWATAAVEMMDSKWATQVGDRAKRLERMIRTGMEPT